MSHFLKETILQNLQETQSEYVYSVKEAESVINYLTKWKTPNPNGHSGK